MTRRTGGRADISVIEKTECEVQASQIDDAPCKHVEKLFTKKGNYPECFIVNDQLSHFFAVFGS